MYSTFNVIDHAREVFTIRTMLLTTYEVSEIKQKNSELKLKFTAGIPDRAHLGNWKCSYSGDV